MEGGTPALPQATKQLIDGQLKRMEEMPVEELEPLSSFVTKIVRQLHALQVEAGPMHRFYLLVESEKKFHDEHSGRSDDERDITSRVLFSPTVRTNCSFSVYAYGQICDMLHIFALEEMDVHETANSCTAAHRNAPNPAESRKNPSVVRTGTNDEGVQGPASTGEGDVQGRENVAQSVSIAADDGNRIVCERENVSFGALPSYVKVNYPPWFPRKPSNWHARMPGEGEDLIRKGDLIVLPRSVAMFQELSRDDVLACYRMFFNILHKHAKTALQLDETRKVGNVFEYNMFTPSWLTQTVKCGSMITSFDASSLPNIRCENTRIGQRRLTLLLAAFYQMENDAFGSVIEYIMQNLSVLRMRMQEASEKRKRKRPLLDG